MGREAMIRADMESVGTYNAIFEPTNSWLSWSGNFPKQKKPGVLPADRW